MLIKPYQKSWATDFANIKQVLANVLVNLDVTIEHIGSTALGKVKTKKRN